jgi:hypothetical protein
MLLTIYLANPCAILRTINQGHNNMPRNNTRVDTCFQKTVKLLLKHPALKVPEAMKLADFSCEEQDCRAKRMIIYHQLTKSSTHINNAFLTPPPQSSVVVGMGSSHSGNDWGTLSSVTLSSSSSSPGAPPAVLKKARSTVTAAQLHQAEALHKKKEHNAAFKHATSS